MPALVWWRMLRNPPHEVERSLGCLRSVYSLAHGVGRQMILAFPTCCRPTLQTPVGFWLYEPLVPARPVFACLVRLHIV